jgi:hypothetical protein
MNTLDSAKTAGVLDCPACGLPAEIVDHFTFDGSPHPVEHVKIICLAGHWYTPPLDYLPAVRREQHGREGTARRPIEPTGAAGVTQPHQRGATER